MSRVVAVVEGQTEQTFIRDVLAPWLAPHGVDMHALLVGRPGHKGSGNYDRARRDILAQLRQQTSTVVTTMFDFYGLPAGWPGRTEAAAAPHHRRAALVEERLASAVAAEMGGNFRPDRFVPYIQMHEFEALLFARPAAIAEAARMPKLAAKFMNIGKKFPRPEEIDDGPSTAPSKRILALIPTWQKTRHGPLAAAAIGVESMLETCPHFRDWVTALEGHGDLRGSKNG